jgi:hypothetical protein
MLAVLSPAARGSGAVEASGAQDDPPPTLELDGEGAPVDPLAEGLIDAPEASAQAPTRTLIVNLGAEAIGQGRRGDPGRWQRQRGPGARPGRAGLHRTASG